MLISSIQRVRVKCINRRRFERAASLHIVDLSREAQGLAPYPRAAPFVCIIVYLFLTISFPGATLSNGSTGTHARNSFVFLSYISPFYFAIKHFHIAFTRSMKVPSVYTPSSRESQVGSRALLYRVIERVLCHYLDRENCTTSRILTERPEPPNRRRSTSSIERIELLPIVDD